MAFSETVSHLNWKPRIILLSSDLILSKFNLVLCEASHYRYSVNMKITIICAVFLMACSFSATSAFPDTYSIDKFDRDVSDLEYDYRNSRLRRSYYDDEYYGYYPYYTSYSPYRPRPIQPVVQPIRRQDVDDDKDYKYEPLVRYSSRQTKRKKLFVPNLWG